MTTRFADGFRALYAVLEAPHVARRVVLGLLVIHSALLAYSAYVQSPTNNEPGHLAAGLSHWEFGRFELYRVNPPLVRMVAALPVMAAGYEGDWSGFYERPGARPEMGMGRRLVKSNGERSFWLFALARWACIPFSCLGAVVCYLWGRDLYGRPAGVLACTIWCFEPTVLAHAALITPDAHATSLGLAACYTFWRWLRRPTWSQAALTGVVLGLAELAKTTLVVLYPVWPLLWLAYRWPQWGTMLARDWVREAGMLGLRLAVGIYVLNLGYGFEGSLERLGQYRFVSALFTGRAHDDPRAGFGDPATIENRFVGTWLAEAPVPFPRNYLLGIDVQQRDFEDYRTPSYLRGEWRDTGWWYYYLYALAVKVPLAFWLMALVVVVARVKGAIYSRGGPPLGVAWRDEMVLLAPAVVILTVASIKTGFNEHTRYVLPALPYLYIAVSQVARLAGAPAANGRVAATAGGRRPALVAGLTCWLVASSLWTFPHSLSYFNEAVGGPRNGPRHLLGSNVDWGQGLRYVKWWAESRDAQAGGPVYLNYLGPIEPQDVGIELPRSVGDEQDRGKTRGARTITSANVLFHRLDKQGVRTFVDSNAEPVLGYSLYAVGWEESAW